MICGFHFDEAENISEKKPTIKDREGINFRP
jgi:hypothetical protein